MLGAKPMAWTRMSRVRVGLGEGGEDGVDLVVEGYVALEGSAGLPSRGELGGEGFGVALEALGLVADGEGGAGFGELLADGPGDAALVGKAEDDGDFAFEVDHEGCSFDVDQDSSEALG